MLFNNLRNIFKVIFKAQLLLILGLASTHAQENILRMATTTSTENSGLTAYLFPSFENKHDIKIHVIATGTGKALRLGEDGDVDILLVHAPKSEIEYVKAGHGIDRRGVMYNDFVIVGPKNDPAGIKDSSNAAEAMSSIAETESLFTSRGDDSGTHKKELSLWNSKPNKNSWYRETGQGMGRTLQIANQLGAYTLVDRGTWLAKSNTLELDILYSGDEALFNPYSVITVNPEKYSDINATAAKKFSDWIVSDEAQTLINEFRINGEILFHASAN